MANGEVASCAEDSFGFAVDLVSVDGLRDVLMTAATRGFRHLAIELGDLDCVRILA
jgi:hypothetical protein